MNKYKLGNISKKDLLKKFKNSDIEKKKLSLTYLKKLCDTYPICEYVYSRYCCYGEDRCCWQDEERCWMFSEHLTTHQLNLKIYNSIKGVLLKELKKQGVDIYKRKIFFAENDKVVWVEIPLRDVLKEDITIIFDKERTLE